MSNTYRPREADKDMDLTWYQASIALLQLAGIIGAAGLICMAIDRGIK
jgi:hypothetical protein